MCTYAYLICLMASSSSRTQSCQVLRPYCIVPKMILETFSPDFPRRTASSKLLTETHYIDDLNLPYFIFLDGNSTAAIISKSSWKFAPVGSADRESIITMPWPVAFYTSPRWGVNATPLRC